MAQDQVQQGFEYEKKAWRELSKYKISTGDPAGGAHNKPDLMIQSSGKKIGCELKSKPTAAGSLVMKFYDGMWTYGETKGDVDKQFVQSIGEQMNLLKEMNSGGSYGRQWRGKTPHLQNDPKNPKKKVLVGARDMHEAYRKDIAKFGASAEVIIIIPAQIISQYYIGKNCSYLNVGTHGFYTLNGKDFLGLNPRLSKNKLQTIPDFSRSANATIRVRCQYKNSGDYQFSMTLQFTSIKKSMYNLAPIKMGSKSDIDTKALQANPILMAFK